MTEVPSIFDDRLRRLRRRRSAARVAAAGFLREEIAAELSDRLHAINRQFATFVCHGAAHLSQDIAANAFATDIAQCEPGTDGVVIDEAALPFAPHTLDAFASVLSLHAVNDLPGALIQIRQALKPDGLFIGAFLGGDTLTELRQCLADSELEIEGGISPRVFPFLDIKDAGALLQRAGFALPVADSEKLVVHYANPARLLADLRDMGETNVLVQRRRTFLKRRVILRALELYVQRFTGPDGRTRATFEIIYVTGWSPHESQQKPLQPGSARMKLSDAIRRSRQE